MSTIVSIAENQTITQRRRALVKRRRDLRELLAGEAWDPVMRQWRCRQLAAVAVQLGVLELAAAELADA